jgi:hypothetical protein
MVVGRTAPLICVLLSISLCAVAQKGGAAANPQGGQQGSQVGNQLKAAAPARDCRDYPSRPVNGLTWTCLTRRTPMFPFTIRAELLFVTGWQEATVQRSLSC